LLGPRIVQSDLEQRNFLTWSKVSKDYFEFLNSVVKNDRPQNSQS